MPKTLREIRIEGNIAYVPLTRGYEAMIDSADVPLVAGKSWQAKISLRANGEIRSVYAVRNHQIDKQRLHTKMHRLLLGAPPEAEVDHANGDALDNRRKNLRLATKAQNQFNRGIQVGNTSGYKGVSLHKATGKWQAKIRVGGRQVHLGLFGAPNAAHAAYAEASARLHGEFGRIA